MIFFNDTWKSLEIWDIMYPASCAYVKAMNIPYWMWLIKLYCTSKLIWHYTGKIRINFAQKYKIVSVDFRSINTIKDIKKQYYALIFPWVFQMQFANNINLFFFFFFNLNFKLHFKDYTDTVTQVHRHSESCDSL